ncbi:putative reverse transcriptase domain-containing protein [Tanacetum coccineum]
MKLILELLQEEKLYAKFTKCEFWLEDVRFLGHVVNKEGIHVDPSKIEAVKNWKAPSTLLEIREFLGQAGYYRRFIENFSRIAQPLTLLTQKDKKFDWGEEQEKSFQTLKDAMCNALILALPNRPDDFVVYCDASGQGLGYILIKTLEAQKEAFKEFNVQGETLRGLDKQIEHNQDNAMYFVGRIYVPLSGNVRTLVRDEAHKLRYSIHPGADKMYHDLRDVYWWPGMKKDITIYVSKCLTCLKVKAEHQRPSVLLQQPEIPEWKWEGIAMYFIMKLPRTSSGHDSIWDIVD